MLLRLGVRAALCLILLLSLGWSSWAQTASPSPSPSPEQKDLTISGVQPLQTRSQVETANGQPVLSDPTNHVFHYDHSLIVTFDTYDRVLTVHGVRLEIKGKDKDITTRDDVVNELGKGDNANSSQKGYSLLKYPRYGLTVFLHDDDVSGFLLEATATSR